METVVQRAFKALVERAVVLVNGVQKVVVIPVPKAHRVSKVQRVTKVHLARGLVARLVQWEARESQDPLAWADLRVILVLQALKVSLAHQALLVIAVNLAKWVERACEVLKETKAHKDRAATKVNMVQLVLVVR